MARSVGILGCGHLGQFLVRSILKEKSLELVFVWDIDEERLEQLSVEHPDVHILGNIEDVGSRKPDLVIEVAHPDVTRKHGVNILSICDYLIGSPSALADKNLYDSLLSAADPHSLYIPSGAFWGGEDIRKMADLDTLERLRVTMTFHPDSLKLMDGEVKNKNDMVTEKTTLYDGPVRSLCKQAPNNVNTMAAAAIAGHTLGFDGVEGRLISDPCEKDRHIVEIEVWAKTDPQTGLKFHVHTLRSNPAILGQVTGSATLPAFFGSILRAKGKGPGIHLC